MTPDNEEFLARAMLKNNPYSSVHLNREHWAKDLEELRQKNPYLGETRVIPRDVIAQMLAEGRIQSEKQGVATLRKWTARDWYDYGVSEDTGWLTPEGIAHFIEKYPC